MRLVLSRHTTVNMVYIALTCSRYFSNSFRFINRFVPMNRTKVHLWLLVISRSLCSPMLKYSAASVKVRLDFSQIGILLFFCFSTNTSVSFSASYYKTKYTWYNLNCLWHRHHRNFTSATACRLSQGVSLSIILLIAHSCHGMLLSGLKSLHTLLSISQRQRRKYIFADVSWRTGNQLPE